MNTKKNLICGIKMNIDTLENSNESILSNILYIENKYKYNNNLATEELEEIKDFIKSNQLIIKEMKIRMNLINKINN